VELVLRLRGLLAAEGFHIALNGFGDEAEIESIRQAIEKELRREGNFFSGGYKPVRSGGGDG
jgi:hypothetical protein